MKRVSVVTDTEMPPVLRSAMTLRSSSECAEKKSTHTVKTEILIYTETVKKELSRKLTAQEGQKLSEKLTRKS